MEQSRPIILIDDDRDDQQLLKEALQDIGIHNKLICFDLCAKAFEYLKMTSDSPFIIICDLNLPRQNGIEFKKQIDGDNQLRSKSIPFIFFSTSVEKGVVNTAYKELAVQGFFQKPNGFEQLKNILQLVMEYWKLCVHPNT